jgi:holo-[acyl-carrier protein] synthase
MKPKRKRPRVHSSRARGPGARQRAAIYGIGLDVLRVKRIEAVYQRHGERFVERLLHPLERKEFEQATRPAQYLAKSFAIKEAFVKAMGTGFFGISHDDVGAVRKASGKPEFVFSKRLKARLKRLKIRSAHVSLSDEGGIVGAVAVLER